jgi:hypothetical protein
MVEDGGEKIGWENNPGKSSSKHEEQLDKGKVNGV